MIDYDVIDSGVKVGDAEAFAMCRVLARRYGLLVGGSAGGAIFAALQAGVAAKKGTRIAVLACDAGTKYLDTIYDDEWLKSQGLDLIPIERSIERMLTPRRGTGVRQKPSVDAELNFGIDPSSEYIQEALYRLKNKGVPDSEIEEIREIAGGDMRCLRRMLERKRFGEPNAYMRGFIELLGRRFSIDRRTYIPDPYPVTLIHHLVSYLPVGATLLEVGTGCGWIATTIACERPDLVIHAADIDPAALAVARQNARQHGASITFHESYFADDVEMPKPDFLIAVLPYGGDALDYSWRELEERPQMPPISIFDPTGPLEAHRGLVDSINRRKWSCEVFMETGYLTKEKVEEALHEVSAPWEYVATGDYSYVKLSFKGPSPSFPASAQIHAMNASVSFRGSKPLVVRT